MRIAFGTDEDTDMTRSIGDHLARLGHQVNVIPTTTWPEIGSGVAQLVASGEVELGVVCCWTGTGVSIAANKVDGIRAALCTDAETARGARRWNDANVLAMGIRLTTETLAREIVDAFLSSAVDDDERDNIAKIR